jgi:hypothetical protein
MNNLDMKSLILLIDQAIVGDKPFETAEDQNYAVILAD